MVALPKPGDTIGRFRIVRQVGRGGMGAVFEAADEVLGRSVAVKVVRPDLADIEEVKTRFEREAAVLAKVRSQHIVHILDLSTHDGMLFIVTDYLADGDLAQWLQAHGALSPVQALHVTAQLADALADAHSVGVVHRDVKPGNVLLWNRGGELVAYICDFGIALSESAAGMTKTGSLIGSPAYMAPERHLGRPADARGDIYSLGCVLWACLTGRPPFSGTDFQIMNAHLHEALPERPHTGDTVSDARVSGLLDRMLAKDPEARPASARALAREIRETIARLEAAVDGDEGGTLARLPEWEDVPESATEFRPWSPTHPDLTTTSGDVEQVGLGATDRAPAKRSVPRGLVVAGAAVAVAAVAGLGLVLSGALSGSDAPTAASGSGAESVAEPSASSSASAAPGAATATAPTSPPSPFTCWDSEPVADLAACSRPSGTAGLEWVFPSFERSGCDQVTSGNVGPDQNRRIQWACRDRLGDGTRALVQYSGWISFYYAREEYDRPGFVADQTTSASGMRLYRWRGVSDNDELPFKGALVLGDYPYSVTVYAATPADRDRALNEVVEIRSPTEYFGSATG